MAVPSMTLPPGLQRCRTISAVSMAAIVRQSSLAVSEASHQSSPMTS